MSDQMEASFSTLVMSIGSSALMSLGIIPNPTNGKIEKNLMVAHFNIDLLIMLKEKTKNNLGSDEQKFINSLIQDLQLKYVECSKKQ